MESLTGGNADEVLSRCT